jgi:hypothetical protein
MSEEMVTLDRKTLEEIFSLIGDCVDTITNLRHSDVFITSAKRCLLDTVNLELASSTEVGKAVLLMNSWLEVIPKSHKEMDAWLQQANAITYLALAPIKLGKSNG